MCIADIQYSVGQWAQEMEAGIFSASFTGTHSGLLHFIVCVGFYCSEFWYTLSTGSWLIGLKEKYRLGILHETDYVPRVLSIDKMYALRCLLMLIELCLRKDQV